MDPHPPLSDALLRIGDRWSLLLVDALMEGPLRFGDLAEAVGGISTNILAARLRHLEGAGVVLAVPYSERPVRYSYELTASGRDLAGAVRLLAQWGADHLGSHLGGDPGDPSGAGRRHRPEGPPGRGRSSGRPGAGAPLHPLCGTAMMAVWWCPTCDQPAGPDSEEAVWV